MGQIIAVFVHTQQVTELKAKIASMEEEKNRERRRYHIEKTVPIDKFVNKETGQLDEEKYNQRIERLMNSSFTEEDITQMYDTSFKEYPCGDRFASSSDNNSNNDDVTNGKTASYSSGPRLNGILNMFEDIQSMTTGQNKSTATRAYGKVRHPPTYDPSYIKTGRTASSSSSSKSNSKLWFLEPFEASNFNGGS